MIHATATTEAIVDPSQRIDCTLLPIDAALHLARSFAAGGRLLVRADSCPDHAHHVAVEFVHPVITGARALASIAVSGDPGAHVLAAADCGLAIDASDDLDRRPWGALQIDGALPDADIMTSYHVLWELVQVCLDHPGIVGSAAGPGGDSTGFLYPFLDASETDEGALRRALESSVQAKWSESRRISQTSIRRNDDTLVAATELISSALKRGGRVLAVGNGGSSTDAARFVRLLGGMGLDAVSLAADYAVLSALANDVGMERVFARQLEALARPGDVLVAFSTSGTSANLLAAFDQADSMGVAGIGFAGYDGGAFEGHRGVAHCLVVESSSVHRIQEAQARLIAALFDHLSSSGMSS